MVNQELQMALLADSLMLPATARIVALISLIAFAVITVAAVPLELRFFQRLHRRALPWALGLELLVFSLIVFGFVGFILDWFEGVRGLALASALLVGLWLVVMVYLVLRILLAYRTYLGQREDAETSREALKHLLAAIEGAEKRKREKEASTSRGSPDTEIPEKLTSDESSSSREEDS